MKKIISIALFFLAQTAFCGSQSIGGQWGGLNNADASVLVGDNESQDLSNVDITDNGYGIKKRDGYAQYKTIGVSTWAVRGGYYFKDAGSNDEIIHTNDTKIFKSVNGAAYSAFVTTDTAGSYYDFTDSQGSLWRANSSRDEILKYDGTTVTYYPSAPKGDQIEALPSRLAISGTTANPNYVNFSQDGDFTNFTTGTDEGSPFTESFGLPGQKINTMKWANGRLVVWTKTTTSYWVGNNQFDGEIMDVSLTVGTNQPNSVIFDQGIVYWQGQDRHFYGYDGNIIQKISNKLDVSNIVAGESRAWLTTTQSDFQSGTVGTGLSATDSPGDVLFSEVTIDNFSDGDYTASPAWSLLNGSCAPSTSVSSERLLFNPSGGCGLASALLRYNNSISTISVLATFNKNGSSDDVQLFLYTANPTNTVSTPFCPAGGSGYALAYDGSASTIYLLKCASAGLGTTLASVSQTISNGDDHVFMLERNSSSAISGYLDGSLILGPVTDTSYSSATVVAIGGAFVTNLYFDDIKYKPYSGVYQSQAFNVGSAITQWGAFDVNNTLNSGTIDYVFYVDSNASITLSDPATFTSSQTITSGSIPTVAVGPYVTWTATFTRTASTQNPTLNDVTVNWFEGSQTRHFGTVDKNHRLMWSVAEGTATVPNVTYIYDPRFESWLKYSFPMDAPARVGDSIYFGGVSTGVVYNWPSGNSDDGSAMTAYWKSKDFVAPDPFIEKDFLTYSILGNAQSGSNIDFTYTVNTSSAVSSNYSMTADVSGSNYRRINSYFPSGEFGTLLNLKFGNDDADAPFEIYLLKYDYAERPWRVLP